MLTLLAPAKLNLTLEVVAKRPDGFHEICSVIQAINLCDRLQFQLSQGLTFKCDEPKWLPEKSLVSKAVTLLRDITGCSKGATIEINKRIPLVSGLGGDSSDAAAILRGLNRLWDLGLPLAELVRLASLLGSDVAFFLHGGTALAKGRGEIITPLSSLPHRWVVLIDPPVPEIPNKTERLYAAIKSEHYTRGQITDRLLAALNSGGEVTPSMLFNVFESVAWDMFDWLSEYRSQLLEAGAESVHLAGSGPTLFTLAKDKAQADKIHQNLQQQGVESYLAETLETVDQVTETAYNNNKGGIK